jgi:hypothetical protein
MIVPLRSRSEDIVLFYYPDEIGRKLARNTISIEFGVAKFNRL